MLRHYVEEVVYVRGYCVWGGGRILYVGGSVDGRGNACHPVVGGLSSVMIILSW